ncbi:tyrosine-type recombinase/integrase [Methanolobus sp.]|uniref:tyrosine-type recombinase/integrase n=1 Tax=Methanolobus sp. TaxID=1874737 RepID=UPI0025F88C00|nr:tyrosine-type recombinase/integrase [Methanolobus sp.]
MNTIDIEKDPVVIKLFSLINPAKSTRQGYLSALAHYTKFTELTPSELIDEGNRDIKAGKLMTDRAVFVRIPGFRDYLQKQNNKVANPLAPSTIKKHVGKIISFYNYFYIDTPKQPRSGSNVKPLKENLKRPDKDLIRAALDIASIRDKAVMLIGLSSGMGASEIASLKVAQFNEGYDSKTGITTFDMRRRKVGIDFITFISPEASKAVLNYLEWRDRPPAGSEKCDLLEYEKRKVTPGSYLFIQNKVKKEYLLSQNESIRRLTSENITLLYNRISADLGARAGPGIFNPLRSHNMRKYFNTSLKNEGMDSDLIEYMMGHQLDGSKAAYFEGDPEKLKKIYQKYIPFITIKKELDISESPEYTVIKNENDILRAETAKTIVERHELSELKSENAEIKAELGDMKSLIESAINDKVAELLKKNIK